MIATTRNWFKQHPAVRRLIVGSLIFALVVFVIIQLVPVERTNPPVVKAYVWKSPSAQAIAERACNDCHSNNTQWIWNAYIAPISWIITRDVRDGRAKFNFSDWNAQYPANGQLLNVFQNGSMPPLEYEMLHWNAILSDADRRTLIDEFAPLPRPDF